MEGRARQDETLQPQPGLVGQDRLDRALGLVIHPDECIDCGVCEPECPVEAILPDTEGDLSQWVEHNRIYSEQWPNITRMGTPPADADDWRGVPDKMKHFSPNPGSSGGT